MMSVIKRSAWSCVRKSIAFLPFSHRSTVCPAASNASVITRRNTGSSSIKYRVIDPVSGEIGDSGIIERIGEPGSDATDHAAALRQLRDALGEREPDAVGHRIVHGGALYTGPTLIDDSVERGL